MRFKKNKMKNKSKLVLLFKIFTIFNQNISNSSKILG